MADVKRNVWLDKLMYDEAERIFYEGLAKKGSQSTVDVCERSVPKSDKKPATTASVCHKQSNTSIEEKIKQTETTIRNLVKEFQEVKDLVMTFDKRLKSVESFISKQPPAVQSITSQTPVQQPSTSQNKNDEDPDDGVDLFGSDSDEDDEAKKLKEQRLAMYAEKKSKKPTVVAKSNIILDVKPWDDETDMKVIEELVRGIKMDGLLWGASKLVPLAYGIQKLQISCVVEDDKVSVDLLTENIEDFKDHVQSVDIAAFNKI